MSLPQEFQQILWDDWVSCYWVDTISLYEPILFLKVFNFKHQDEKKPDLKGEKEITIQYIRGDDGFTYKQTAPAMGVVVLVPIYQFNKEIF